MWKQSSPVPGDIFADVKFSGFNLTSSTIAQGTVVDLDLVPDSSGDAHATSMAQCAGVNQVGSSKPGILAFSANIVGASGALDTFAAPPTNQATARVYGPKAVVLTPGGILAGKTGLIGFVGVFEAICNSNFGVADRWFPLSCNSSAYLIKLAGSAAQRRVLGYYIGRQNASTASNPGRQTADNLSSTSQARRLVYFDGRPVIGPITTA